jgi:dipeptidyl aminopeptidase/acylaminoacyl peptidase
LEQEIRQQLEQLKAAQEGLQHVFAQLQKTIDDVLWYHKVSDVADLRTVVYCGPPPANLSAQPPQDRGNPVKIKAYVFTPKGAQAGQKYPLLVYVHGGVHANFASSGANIIRELVAQGYLVISPDYRGSTGYGEYLYRLIDYGGLEVEDALGARDFMVENDPLVDPDRVGILGWSHGGLITLFNLFRYPERYKVGYAAVPVSDLVARMAYKGPAYHALFSADHHIGKPAWVDPWEYKRRSPAYNADRLQTPLLIHTTTNDEDVNVLEVEHLIKSLQAAGKQFEYKIYDAAPGAHAFNRIDTKLAQESRREIYAFLARYLCPPQPWL